VHSAGLRGRSGPAHRPRGASSLAAAVAAAAAAAATAASTITASASPRRFSPPQQPTSRSEPEAGVESDAEPDTALGIDSGTGPDTVSDTTSPTSAIDHALRPASVDVETEFRAVERALRDLDATAAADVAVSELTVATGVAIRKVESASSDSTAVSQGLVGDKSSSVDGGDLMCAADNLQNSLRPAQALPQGWRVVLQHLAEAGLRGEALSKLFQRGGLLSILSLEPDRVRAVFHLLKCDLCFSNAKLFHVITLHPELLANENRIHLGIEVLRALHMSNREIQGASYRWPGILTVDFDMAHSVINCLCAPSVGFTTKSLRSIVRRAPWILVYDIERDIMPALSWLQDSFLMSYSSVSIESVVRASPQILGTCPESMSSVVDFLRSDLLAEDDVIVSVVRQFPAILTSSVGDVLQPTARYLSHELGLSAMDLSRIVRAFPAILCLDIATEIEPNVHFFREHGIVNIGRIVSRLPPVLSYDIKTNLAPKMEYLMNGLGLSAYDVLLFPGYFSYSLTECIEPRTRFLQKLGVPLIEFGLNMALSTTDDVFCERIAMSDVKSYIAFRQALAERRSRLQSQDCSQAEESKLLREECCMNSPSPTTDLSASADPVVATGRANSALHVMSDTKILGDLDADASATILPRTLRPLTPPQPRRRKRKQQTTDSPVSWRNGHGASSSSAGS
jgi:mTERF